MFSILTLIDPEAKGGPMDSAYLFDNYLEQVRAYKEKECTLSPVRDNRPNPLLVDLLSKQRVGVTPERTYIKAAPVQ